MKPYRTYAKDADPAAMYQLFEALKLDCVVRGAVMPDVHKGYSLPIGAVVATEGMVFPSWVGFDIGCGMCAVPTTFDRSEIVRHRKILFEKIYETIPTGLGAHQCNAVGWDLTSHTSVVDEIWKHKNGNIQLGTLGSGNHFIEIGYDEQDRIWLIVHSGSRGIGHATASHYMALASKSKKAKEGNYGLRADSQEGQDYTIDQKFCLAFALESRRVMLKRLVKVLQKYCSGRADWEGPLWINRNHNHAEERDGLWIHRKGATHAEKDMLGVVPGNMRDGAFIVRGKGNPESLWSSSHGAGRAKGRREAKNSTTLPIFESQMEGITARVDKGTMDESPDAYKNIFEVMALQADLVDVLHYVKPIINIKG